MIIECAAQWPRPKVDWYVDVTVPGLPRVLSTDSADPRYQRLDGELLCDAAARWLGFDVDSAVHVVNWDAVPHLWSLVDVKSQGAVQNVPVPHRDEWPAGPWHRTG